jgi:hypothetical protein
MLAIHSVIRIGIRMRLAVALSLLVPGLVLAAGVGVASAAASPGHTIASAGTLSVGSKASGGGGAIDFWKVKLHGGDRVQFSVSYPEYNTYEFALYAPGTTDAKFAAAATFSSAAANYYSTKSVLVLQAPYNGTFILAVCENVSSNNCANVDSGSGTSPMNAYTFTTTKISGPTTTQAAAETKAASSIKSAPTMTLGHYEAGGANPIDFWKVHLNGGQKVQITTTYPEYNNYEFALYAPGTNDTTFPQAATFSSAAANYYSTKSVLDLQAPYNGTFILAVCQNVSSNNCVNVDSGSGTNPMTPYVFTPTLVSGPTARQAAAETKASPTIKNAPAMSLNNYEAGGGNAIDFWRVHLNGGQKVQITTTYPEYNTYVFSLYKPGTTDTSFPQASAVSSAAANYYSTQSVLDLQAPSAGNFILAVCQNVSSNDCVNVDSGSGTNPMTPYVFSTKSSTSGAPVATTTTLKPSSSSVTSGHEKSLVLSVTVAARSGKTVPSGTVKITAGKKTVCSVKLSKGKGKCSPSSSTLLAPGTYSLTASYGGAKGLAASHSSGHKLTVKKG